MVKPTKDGLLLSEEEYEKLERIIIDDKVFFILRNKKKEFDIVEMEKLILIGYNKVSLVNHFNTTVYKINNFLQENYRSKKIEDINLMLQKKN